MKKRVQLKITLREEEALLFKQKLLELGFESLTAMVRKMIKCPARHPRPCAEYHASKQQGTM